MLLRKEELQLELASIQMKQDALKRQELQVRNELMKINQNELKTITTEVRKGSAVIKRKDGLAIVVQRKKNAHGENTVSWYNGKKGSTITTTNRSSLNSLKHWLLEQPEMA